MKRTVVLGTEIDSLTMEQAVDRAMKLMEGHNGAYVVTPNSEMLVRAMDCPELRMALQGAALSLPDGVGVLLASHILGMPIPRRLTGIDFASRLMDTMARTEKSVFLLGARPGVAERAAQRLKRRYPGLIVVGTNSGYFAPEEERDLIARINAAAPDLLLVCLGSPKQELWMAQHSAQLSAGLMAGLGGALDVFAGRIRRAPKLWRRLGLEWLYRLLCQPRRLLRILSVPRLFWVAICIKIGGTKETWIREN